MPGQPSPARYAVRMRYLSAFWEELVSSGGPVPQLDRWVARRLRRERALGKRDRRWYTDMLFAAFRFGVTAIAAEQQLDIPDTEGDLPHTLRSVSAACDALRHMPAARLFDLTALRAGLSGADLSTSPEARPLHRIRDAGTDESTMAWHGLGPWLAPSLRRRASLSGWSEIETRRFVTLHDLRPPVWLRPHSPADLDTLAAMLTEQGLEVRTHDGAVAVSDSPGIAAVEKRVADRATVQDLASQAIGRTVRATNGESVWDCCAGAGGKTLQLMADRAGAHVAASDTRRSAREEIHRRARVAGLRPPPVHLWDATASDLPPFAPSGGFDWVLIDAPCSGSGTWRRAPDGQWRCSHEHLQHLTDTQTRLIQHARRAVRPGGHIVYATCSWLPEENEDIVSAAAALTPSLVVVNQHLHGCPSADADTTFTCTLQRVV